MPGTAPLDHVVIAVRDLDAAARRYERLGFTLTPRAQHPWGTANRLVQFSGGNFIELLEIDRPHLVAPHNPPAHFSFGAFNRDFLAACGEGFSMLVLKGENAPADVQRFAEAGLTTYAPFDFERQATLPDGRAVKVAFSLAFASHPAMPRAAFFTCHHHYPENFWRNQFQSHANGATGIDEAILVAADPAEISGFVAGFTGSAPQHIDGGFTAACGAHTLTVLTPGAYVDRVGAAPPGLALGPRLAAVVVQTGGATRALTPPQDANGVAILWR